MKAHELIRTMCFTLCLAMGAIGPASAEEEAMPTSVDINRADARTLATVLDGVGVVKAEAIVRYREMHGGFATIEELANVTGIGLSTVDRNQGRIVLGQD
jgi:competence protein ComEA